jgi:hypothetical protein
MLNRHPCAHIDRRSESADANRFALDLLRFLFRRCDDQKATRRSTVVPRATTSAPPIVAEAVVLPAIARNSNSPAMSALIPSLPRHRNKIKVETVLFEVTTVSRRPQRQHIT